MPEPMDACKWLNILQGSRLSDTARLLVEKISDAPDFDKDAARIHNLVERLSSLGETSTDPFEKAEINVQRALTYYRLGEYAQAVRLLEGTEATYQPHRHYTAVELWMKGCILWKIPGQHDQAFKAWSQSQELFTRLSSFSSDPQQISWYTARAREVNDALSIQLDRERTRKPESGPQPQPQPQPKVESQSQPQPQPNVESQSQPQPQPNVESQSQPQPAIKNEPQPQPTQAQAASRDNEALLQLFRVIEKIPAGGFGPVGYDAVTIGAIEVNQVLINEKPYRIASLRGAERLIRLPANHYVVIEVTGDSMNNPAGKLNASAIDKGDFVLLLEQTNAKDGDIVAAEIDNEDSSATLKRFHIGKEGARYILSPESTNPEYQPRQFTHLDEGFHIRGVALAVFKPI